MGLNPFRMMDTMERKFNGFFDDPGFYNQNINQNSYQISSNQNRGYGDPFFDRQN